MSQAWGEGTELEAKHIGAMGWIRAVSRGLPLAVVVFGGLLILLTIRLVEKPIWGVK